MKLLKIQTMPSKTRQLPMEISIWVEKDVTLPKPSDRATSLVADTKENAVLNRKFFSDMMTLSSERYRTLSRCDLDKQSFLDTQRIKAERSMPGLLPLIEQKMPASSRSQLSFSKSGRITSSSYQSTSSLGMKQSESNLPSISPKPRSKRQQESLERINRLAQPRGRPHYSTDHVRSHLVQPMTVRDLFGDLDSSISNINSAVSIQSKSSISDKHFNQIFEVFSEVHEPDASAEQQKSVKNIIQSNPSLQDEEGRWQMANVPLSRTAELKKHIKKLNEQFANKSRTDLIDLCTC